MKQAFIVAGVIVVAVACMAASRWYGSRATEVPEFMRDALVRAVRRSARAATLSEQDKNPLVAMIHNVEALAALDVVDAMTDPGWIQRHCRVDPDVYRQHMERRQASLVRLVGQKCPAVAIKGKHVAGTGWAYG